MLMIRYKIVIFLLWVINKIKTSPSEYARIDNIEYFSRSFLEFGNQQKTIKQFLEESDLMTKCVQSVEDCVIVEGIVIKDNLNNHI